MMAKKKPTVSGCLEAVDNLIKAQCGLAFVQFLSNEERLKQTHQEGIHYYDVRGALGTTRGAAEMASRHMTEDLSHKALLISKSAGSLARKYDGLHKKKDMPNLRNKVSGMMKKLDQLIDDTKSSCTRKTPKR